MLKSNIESTKESSIKPVVKEFEESGLYTNDFIKDLESGLRKSAYNSKKK